MDVRCDIGFDIVLHSYVTETGQHEAWSRGAHETIVIRVRLDSLYFFISISVPFYNSHYIMYILFRLFGIDHLVFSPSSSVVSLAVVYVRADTPYYSFSASFRHFLCVVGRYRCALVQLLSSCANVMPSNNEMVVWCFISPSALSLLCALVACNACNA